VTATEDINAIATVIPGAKRFIRRQRAIGIPRTTLPTHPGLSLALRATMMGRGRARTLLIVVAAIVTTAAVLWFGVLARTATPTDPDISVASGPETATDKEDKDKDKDDEPLSRDKRTVSEDARGELLKRAQVWRQPRTPIALASLRGATVDEVSCRFKVSDLGGTTPKFDCVLDTGEQVRIKYGNGPEIPAEAAATRLLTTLGFLADEITLVRKLRCYGCPKEPFSVMKAVEVTRAEPIYKQVVNFDEFEDFEWVGLERKFNARPVESENIEGWSFFELDTIDPGRGGAPRAHIDALRMIAVLLAHWDNKSENQRIVCLAENWREDTPCPSPFLLLQDVGATFGPTKFDLAKWKQVPMWDDRDTCTVSMRHLPFEGATFGQASVTEAGRQLTLELLTALSDRQLAELFELARFGEKRGVLTPVSSIDEWVETLKLKVRAISDGPPCPSSTVRR
jgi:hypothetical protein